ncbi:sugar acetyltransferase [Sphingomonas changnyeongensis]|uniref:Sugar acetyltransferase n=1 Tax=Sphingomonas changnyeongensis TaxID=2698679 RepID=A0A7Z2NUV3_9SPHN|nr:NeuD/PglB/VioB family sugar acetyltransferase [Sphingomonas changnyeongensis]QHL90231.1 sugar acetyltransferase [Sphingomonas changnyeongensis]
MTIPEILLWGGTGQARVLHELIGDRYRIAAVVDRALDRSPFDQAPLLRHEGDVEHWLASRGDAPLVAAVAIGGGHGAERRRLAGWLNARGVATPTLIHGTAVIASNSHVGDGCQILAGAIVAAGVRLGSSVIINTGAQVDHDSSVGDGSHIGPGAVTAGEISIGEDVFVGTGAIIMPRVSIGRGATIGAGAVVVSNVAPGATVVGCPARPISK